MAKLYREGRLDATPQLMPVRIAEGVSEQPAAKLYGGEILLELGRARIRIERSVDRENLRFILERVGDDCAAGRHERCRSAPVADKVPPPRFALQKCSPTAFGQGPTEVDLYKHLDSGRLVAARGTISMEPGGPLLRVTLKLGEWPPGQYIIGIAGHPYFGCCTVDVE